MNRLSRTATLTTALVALLLTAITLPAMAERGDDAERKSKNGQVEGTLDGVTVTLDYGRPEVRGRDIFGALVPFGKVWRTGADEATTITFSADAMVEGKAIAAGTYALFTIPGEGQWTVIFNATADQWGAFGYAEDADVLRVDVPAGSSEMTEAMTFTLGEGAVHLMWADVEVSFSVTAAAN